MADHKSGFTYFQHHAISVSDDRFSRMSVKPHPHGGWTIAEQEPTSSLVNYRGNYASEKLANISLSQMRMAAVQTHIKDKLAQSRARIQSEPQIELALGM